MWLLLGVGAIITATLNIICYINEKNAEIFRFLSLSLTALTLCAFYNMNAKWVVSQDWVALMDVVPTMSKTLLSLTIVSIIINSLSLIKKK